MSKTELEILKSTKIRLWILRTITFAALNFVMHMNILCWNKFSVKKDVSKYSVFQIFFYLKKFSFNSNSEREKEKFCCVYIFVVHVTWFSFTHLTVERDIINVSKENYELLITISLLIWVLSKVFLPFTGDRTCHEANQATETRS